MIKQTATALITALFVMTLVAIAAASIAFRLQIDIRRTEIMLNASHLYYMAQYISQWGRNTLTEKVGLLPLPFPFKPNSSIKIDGQLQDAQGRFNLNNLANLQSDPKKFNAITAFTRLIMAVDPSISPTLAENIAFNTASWVSDQPTPQQQQNDKFYLQSNNPYQVPHHLMKSISELRLVRGVTPQLYLQLRPYIIVLPEVTAINLNSAEAPVLMSLSATMTAAQAQQIIAHRQASNGFQHLDDVLADPAFKTVTIDEGQTSYTLNSKYFYTIANVTEDNQQLTLMTLLQRIQRAPDTPVIVSVIWESRNSF